MPTYGSQITVVKKGENRPELRYVSMLNNHVNCRYTGLREEGN